MIFTILIALFVLGVLILVHELGHFIAAKLVDVQVLRFSIGLGKPLVKWVRGETEYTLSAIPFGGYVKMAGDDPAEGLEGDVDAKKITTDPSRHFENKHLLKRFFVIFSGPFANLLLAVFLYQGIFYFQGPETLGTTVIETVDKQTAPPGSEGIQDWSQVLSVNGREVKIWNDVFESIVDTGATSTVFELRESESDRRYTVTVPTAIDSLRVQLAFSLLAFQAPRIGGLVPDKPAKKAGLRTGDLILEINSQKIRSWREMTRIIYNSADKSLTLKVDRGGKPLNFEITPELGKVPQEDGSFSKKGLIGIEPSFDRIPLSLDEAITEGASHAVFTTVYITRGLFNILTGLLSRRISLGDAKDVVGGPVLIGQMAGEWARSGRLWTFMAIISINLAILNLLPIPVLDGGHLLFLLIEVVRFGRPLSQERRIRLIQVGMILVFGLMILALANDFRRVFGL
ncbi:MAG: RIP metalloprotease RseP [Candidatus Glassbacteria bacterium]